MISGGENLKGDGYAKETLDRMSSIPGFSLACVRLGAGRRKLYDRG
jgi:hypothetical protein